MDRLRQVASGTYHLEVEAALESGALVTPAAPLTVAITDGAGAARLAPTAAIAITDGIAYEAAAALLPALDLYACTWTGTVAGAAKEWQTRLELCGGYLFEVADLRAFDDAFADPVKYPDARIRAKRTAAEQRLEKACHVAFVPRARRLLTVGSGSSAIGLPDNAVRRVVSLAVDGALMSADELTTLDVREWGRIGRTDGLTFADGALVSVFYEHGQDFPDEPVAEAAKLLTREYLVKSPLSSRATVEATDVGFFRVSVAGKERPTGIPEVDAVIADFGRARPRMA